ncbi:MAG TPA: efflux RND transporter permease subunit, partial [Rhizobiales bacterium]|nr:efflux RND transporter permease subunit [Hyphomicrobiales bacterium]
MEGTQAYILAAKRMFWPIFSSTATTLAAFLPMLLWPGVAGKFMSFLPITVIVVLSASFITAMVFLPVLGNTLWRIVQFLSPAARRRKAGAHSQPGHRADQPPAPHVFEVRGFYGRLINMLIWHPLKVVLSIALLVTIIVQSFGVFGKGVEFIPAADFEQAVVFVRARGNLSALEKLDLTQQVEKIVLGVNGVRSAFTSAGVSGGLDFGPNTETDAPRDTIGRIYLEFRAAGSRPEGAEILKDIRRKTASLPGIYIDLQKKEEGPPTGKDIRLQIRSDDYARLKRAVAKVRQYFDTKAGDLRDIEDDRPLPGIEWELTVDREEAGRYGTDVASVGGVIQLVTNGILIGTYRPQNAEDEIDIRARFPKVERSLSQLDQLRIRTPKGLVPIRNLVKREAHQRVSTISRSDGLYSMYIKANVTEGVMPDAKVRQIENWLKAQSWPAGVTYKFRGADEEQKKSAAFLQKAMMGALFLMFIILLTQFNSFYQTFLTLMTVVLSVVGVLIGMMVMGQTFSVIMTGTGVVALAGIVVNNAIVLLDTYNRFHEEGMDRLEAIVMACAQRLRPVLLTTITTMIGLAPMMLGMNVNFLTRSIGFGGLTAGWWVPLATAIIFGLGFATVLTLILTPVMVAAPEVYRRKWRGFFDRRAARRKA